MSGSFQYARNKSFDELMEILMRRSLQHLTRE